MIPAESQNLLSQDIPAITAKVLGDWDEGLFTRARLETLLENYGALLRLAKGLAGE